jgi:hypothetical protein
MLSGNRLSLKSPIVLSPKQRPPGSLLLQRFTKYQSVNGKQVRRERPKASSKKSVSRHAATVQCVPLADSGRLAQPEPRSASDPKPRVVLRGGVIAESICGTTFNGGHLFHESVSP